MTNPPVVVLAGVRWGFLWQRHHALATRFARAGYPTVFVETTGLSSPKLERKSLEHILRRISRGMRRSASRSEPHPEANLSIYSPLALPPTSKIFRRMNERFFVPKISCDLRRMAGDAPIVVAYPPTRTTLDIVSRLEPRLVFYDCADEYAAFPGAPGDTAATERELLRRADLVSCTSEHLLKRVKKLRLDAFLSGPGVEYELFEPLAKEEKSGDARTVCYFGDLDDARMDFDVLEAVVGAGFRLRIVGGVGNAGRKLLESPGVEYVGEVPHRELPRAISGADAFVLPYKVNRLTRGISPAKTFECLATGKPVVSAPLPAMKGLAEYVYLADTPEDFVEAFTNLGSSETEEKAEARREEARRNSWGARFAEIEERIWRKLREG